MVYHAQGEYAYADQILFGALDKLRKGFRQNLQAPATVTDWRPWLHDMRLFKSPEELAVMRRAGEISALAHTRAMEKCRPACSNTSWKRKFTMNSPASAPATRLTTPSSAAAKTAASCTTPRTRVRCATAICADRRRLRVSGYAGDITRTFPVNGKFSKPQRAVYDIVLASLLRALALFKPGTSIREVNDEVVRIMVVGLVELGVLKGEVDQLLAEQAHRQFFMHGLSHWLGLDVHDVGHYGTPSRDRLLEPGMVLTVEPGLYIAPDADVPAEYRGIGIRIEDDIVITADGNENLTAAVEKTPMPSRL